MAFFDRSPFIGLANPLAAPITLEARGEGDDRWVEGRGIFHAAYEGPPGNLHGGFVAAAFDEVLGFAQSLSGTVGMTGTLTVRYRSPTPLYQELRFRAQVDGVEGRKIFTSGTCHAGDRLTAEAEAIFVSVDFSKIKDLLAGRERRA
jgi:acyl-coenzyme A thioesterase PaaI-like protein